MALGWLMAGPGVGAQPAVHVKELVSREVSVLVGGDATSGIREVMSREVSIAVENGRSDIAQAISREVGLVVATYEVPPQVTGVAMTVSPTGETVTLDWGAYNQWLVGDIVRFDIYYSEDGPFGSVTNRTPVLAVPGGVTQATLTGLTAFKDHYFAVVAVDALGGYDSSVRYAAAYVLTPQVLSREVSLLVNNGPAEWVAQVISRENSLVVATPEPPPRIESLAVSMSADGSEATLDWSAYNQWAVGDIVRFDIYRSETGPIATVSGMVPVRSVPAGTASVVLEGLGAFRDHYFAVVPVDGLGNFDPVVRYAAGYVLLPQLVSREISILIENGPPDRQVVSREVSLVVPDALIPAPVTGLGSGFAVATSRSAFGAVDLDWSHYNEAAQNDVVRYRIHVGSAFFDNVSTLEPWGFVPAGMQRFTVTGLAGSGIFHFAVVAEDALGNFDATVRSSSAQASIGGVGEVIGLAVVSGPDRLSFTWAPPGDAGEFLAAFRLYLGAGGIPVQIPPDATSYEFDGLTPATGYTLRMATLDIFGRESDGTTLVAATWLPNPTGVRLEVEGGSVWLAWNPVSPGALVREYAVFDGLTPFDQVSGRTPLAVTSQSRAVVGTLEAVTGRHFAVATVNVSGGTDPAVVSVSAVRESQTVDFPAPPVEALVIPLAATASSGLPVRFLGGDPEVAALEGNLLHVLQGGSTTLLARQDGNDAWWPAETSRTLRIPPVIVTFTANGEALEDGQVLYGGSLRLAVTAADKEGIVRAEFSVRTVGETPWTPLGQDESAADGWMWDGTLAGLASGELDLRVTVFTASGAARDAVRRVVHHPSTPADLVAVEIVGPESALAGTAITVRWTVENRSPHPLSGLRRDGLYLSGDAAIGEDRFLGWVDVPNDLGPHAFQNHERSVLLPSGLAGNQWLVVHVDADDTVFEAGAEANNWTIAVGPILVHAVDLEVEALELSAAGGVAGGDIEVEWRVNNLGSAPTSALWQDAILFTTTPGDPAGARVLKTVAGPASLGAGDHYVRRVGVTLPLAGDLPAGAYHLVVRVNAGSVQPEATFENNLASAPFTLTLPPLPDLSVSLVTAPALVVPGEPFEIGYQLTNGGSGPAPAGFGAAIHLATPGGSTLGAPLVRVPNTPPRMPGEVWDQTAVATLPGSVGAGTYRIAVRVDDEGVVVEGDEANNLGLSATFEVAAVLGLRLAVTDVREDVSPPQVSALLSRNSTTAVPLDVLLTSSEPDRLGVPATVRFEVGQSSIPVAFTVVPDGVPGPDASVTITAAASGHRTATADLVVRNVDLPALLVMLDPVEVIEGEAAAGTVFRTGSSGEAVTVNFSASHPSQVILPGPVPIPAGMAEATFTVYAVDDSLVEGTQTYTLLASAPGHTTGSATLTVVDNDVPELELTVTPETFSEGAGVQAAILTVRRSVGSSRDLSVALSSDRPDLVQVPPSVTIPAFNVVASVPVAALDNTEVGPPQTVTLSAVARVSGTAQEIGTPVTVAVTVTDDDGPTLSVALADPVVREGSTTVGTVRRNTGTDGDLLVLLTSSDTAEAMVPVEVVIPDGADSAVFTVVTLEDGVPDGSRSVTVTAGADGYTPGQARLTVTDADLPDLVISEVFGPATALVGERANLTFRVANQGVAPARGRFVQRVFLSRDALVGDDLLIGNFDLTPSGDGFAPGLSFAQTVPSHVFTEVGDYWVVVTADVEDSVEELDETNNTRIAAVPIRVESDFTATVQVDLPGRTAPAGTPVPLSGWALTPGGQPAVGKRVDVHLHLREFRRVLSAITDASGHFSMVFRPLPGEAGHYTVGAARGGEKTATPQDAFTLYGAAFEPPFLEVRIDEGSSVAGHVRLRNLSDVPLTGLSGAILGEGGELSGTVTLSGAGLPGLHFIEAHYTLTAGFLSGGAAMGPQTAERTLRVTTAEGTTHDLPMTVTVEPLRPRLRTEPDELVAGMVRGGQRAVEFTVINEGRADTGPLSVSLPEAAWLRLASPNPMPSLAPGASNTVTLLLSPAADLPFGPYTGHLALNGSATHLRVPFTFRCLSELKGDLLVRVVDEYTYYAEGNPPVTNATVTVTDAFTGEVLHRGLSDNSGEVLFTGLPEGYHAVEVVAPDHATFRTTALIDAGSVREVRAFVGRELVKHRWKVEPTEVEDRTRLTIESTFETFIPVPIITADPPVIVDFLGPGEEKVIELTLTNHGLIAANDVHFVIRPGRGFRVTPLIEIVGQIPARSSIGVPVLLSREADAGAPGGLRIAAGEADDDCSFPEVTVLYQYYCGPDGIWRSFEIPMWLLDYYACFRGIISRNVLDAICSCAALFHVNLGCLCAIYDLAKSPSGSGAATALKECCPSLAPTPGLIRRRGEDGGGGGIIIQPGTLLERWKCEDRRVASRASGERREALNAGVASIPPESEDEGVCARVRLRIEQDAVTTRDAFRATLEVDNGTAESLTEVGVELSIGDGEGVLASELFGVRAPILDGITGVDGGGVIAPQSAGSATWILIPTLDAAPEGPTVYLVGGTLSYTQNGTRVRVPLADVPITVHPGPELYVDYFHQRDVFSDDPFTEEIEPAIPYSLGVMVRNLGRGEARNFRITSGQPQIVENEKGLLIDFNLIGTEVAGETLSPSLTANFGNIAPGGNVIGRWLFTSSLQGLFIDYSATFEHLDAIAGRRLSLIQEVGIHEMIRMVAAPGPFEDGRPDFLINGIPDLEDLPDTVWLSDGTTAPVSVGLEAMPLGVPGGEGGEVAVEMVVPEGFVYMRFPDPAGATGALPVRLAGVRRGDGTMLAPENFWQTDRTFIGLGRRPIRENRVHLFDHDLGGSYTLVYEPVAGLDREAPTSRVATLPAEVGLEFAVRWSGTDDRPGPLSFDVFVSTDDGPFLPWRVETTATSGIFAGEMGRRYAFYSVARDAAGNRELPPVSAHTTTRVGLANRAPVIEPVSEQRVAPGSELRVALRASDPDGDPITWRLRQGPVGLTLDGAGVVRWATGPAHRGTVHAVEVEARDTGVPPLATTSAFQVVVEGGNRPPVAGTDVLSRPPGKPGRMRESRLLVNDTDPDGDTVHLVGVAATSAGGGTIRRSEGWITYTPPPGEDQPDEFTYTITDGEAEATGRVRVIVEDPDGGLSLNILGLTVEADGRVALRMAGIPGRQYALQTASSLLAPVWHTIGVRTADANGRFTFVHEEPPPVAAFYRAIEYTPAPGPAVRALR
ncbi:MAG: cadherin-like domain-containing protein [Verrucomicrobiae bacterium]|nr:cadherin-like domain-containing protein [Verrucomicrobiae bacterium]